MPVYAVALSRTDRDTGRKRGAHRVLGTFQWGLVPSWAKVLLDCAAEEQVSPLWVCDRRSCR
jgi:hypothetical protein